MSVKKSGIWLAGQGIFALIRMAIWIWNPSFDDFAFKESDDKPWNWDMEKSSPNLSETQLGLIWHAQVKSFYQDRSICADRIFVSDDYCLNKDFSMPIWAAKALRHDTVRLHGLFTVAASIHAGLLDNDPEPLSIIHKAQRYWDMPEGLFMSWVLSHARPDGSPQTTMKLCDFSCRVILDEHGKCHVLPFWVISGRLSARNYTIRMLGDLRSDNATLIHISGEVEDDSTTPTAAPEAESDLSSQPFTGWQSPVPMDRNLYRILCKRDRESLEFLDFLGGVVDEEDGLDIEPGQKNWIRANGIHTMDLMWKDLISVLEQIPYSTTMGHGRQGNPVESVPEAFKLIKSMGTYPPEGGRG